MPRIEDWDQLARSIGYDNERQMLLDLYCARQCSISDIAQRLEAGTATINRRLDLAGINKRTRGGSNYQATQSYKLFHLDQRVLDKFDLETLSTVTRVSKSLCYKYRARRNRAILHSESSSGATSVQHFIEEPSDPSADRG
jgi:transposase